MNDEWLNENLNKRKYLLNQVNISDITEYDEFKKRQVEFDRLLLLTVIFRVKVSCITSVDGIKLWLLIWLVNYVALLLVKTQRTFEMIPGFKPFIWWIYFNTL